MSQSKAIAPIDSLRHSIKALEPQFKMALPSHVSVEKFTRTIMTAVQQNQDLVKADRNSLFAACLRSASTGLLPDGKESALVMFGDKAQFMPMLQGMLKLVRNSGELLSITSQIIYEKDVFKYWVDSDGEHLNHEPQMFSDRGNVIGAYALAKTKDLAVYIEVMTMNEIDAVRNVSRSKNNGPWAGPFKHEMYKKSVLRRLIKRLPVSTDLDSVIKADDEDYAFDETDVSPDPISQQAPTSRLEKLIGEDIHTDEAEVIVSGPQVEPSPSVKQKPINHAPGANNEVPL
jgi:recombination protein RecT